MRLFKTMFFSTLVSVFGSANRILYFIICVSWFISHSGIQLFRLDTFIFVVHFGHIGRKQIFVDPHRLYKLLPLSFFLSNSRVDLMMDCWLNDCVPLTFHGLKNWCLLLITMQLLQSINYSWMLHDPLKKQWLGHRPLSDTCVCVSPIIDWEADIDCWPIIGIGVDVCDRWPTDCCCA